MRLSVSGKKKHTASAPQALWLKQDSSPATCHTPMSSSTTPTMKRLRNPLIHGWINNQRHQITNRCTNYLCFRIEQHLERLFFLLRGLQQKASRLHLLPKHGSLARNHHQQTISKRNPRATRRSSQIGKGDQHALAWDLRSSMLSRCSSTTLPRDAAFCSSRATSAASASGSAPPEAFPGERQAWVGHVPVELK